MRVLHLLKTAVGARWALRQMRELVRLGVDVHVAMPRGPRVIDYANAAITVHDLDINVHAHSPWSVPSVLYGLGRLVNDIKPDIIHSHFAVTTVAARIALGPDHMVPRIFQVPGPLHLEHGFFRRLELSLAGSADYWMGSCEWTCREYRRVGIPPGRVFLSYYGVDLEDFTVAAQTRQKKRKPDLLNGEPVVGLVAYMYPPRRYLGQRRGLKGHEDLVDALELCRLEIPKLQGLFVGGAWNGASWYEAKVVAYGTERNRHHNIFLGSQSAVSEAYLRMDLAVCPSRSENVGAAVESLLYGVPTIATNVGGLPDLVRHGETGWLVAPADPRALADAILHGLVNSDKAARTARAGRTLATEMFDIRNTSKQVAEIYGVVSASHRRSKAAP